MILMNKKSMHLTHCAVLWLVALCYSSSLTAALSIDRTRMIINEGEKSASLTVRNQNNYAPYLVQSWLEDSDGNKISNPLVALPPIQRIEAGSKTAVRVQNIKSHGQLPSDRESLFYLNILEVPQKNEQGNILQMALQTRLKVIYRPEHLKLDRNALTVTGLNKLRIKKNHGEYQITNPSPYFITVVSIRNELSKGNVDKFEPFVIGPFQKILKKWEGKDIGRTMLLSIINDYGARVDISLSYDNSNYTVKEIYESNS